MARWKARVEFFAMDFDIFWQKCYR